MRFHFTRPSRARGASYSDRTAKMGQPVEGIRAAVIAALDLAQQEELWRTGTPVTLWNEHGAMVGEVRAWAYDHEPEVRASVTLREALLRQMLAPEDGAA